MRTWLLHPRVLLTLVVVNAAGGVYGFWWYRAQLVTTPWYLWPVVPDSPLSAVVFGAALVFVYMGRRVAVLEALGCLMVFKYGLWAALVIFRYWTGYGLVVFDDVHLFLSHSGMAVQGVLYAWALRPPLWAAGVAVVWAVVNDGVDYGMGVYPRLQHPALFVWARAWAIVLTLASGVLLRWSARRR